MGFFTDLPAILVGNGLRGGASFLGDTVGCFGARVAVDFHFIDDFQDLRQGFRRTLNRYGRASRQAVWSIAFFARTK